MPDNIKVSHYIPTALLFKISERHYDSEIKNRSIFNMDVRKIKQTVKTNSLVGKLKIDCLGNVLVFNIHF